MPLAAISRIRFSLLASTTFRRRAGHGESGRAGGDQRRHQEQQRPGNRLLDQAIDRRHPESSATSEDDRNRRMVDEGEHARDRVDPGEKAACRHDCHLLVAKQDSM